MRVLVFGDFLVDKYVYVKTERNAPEAPIPVWDVISEEIRLGGAANVACNLKALGGDDIDVYVGGILNQDSRQRAKLLGLLTDPCWNGKAMFKTRFVHQDTGEYISRVDSFKRFQEEDLTQLSEQLQFLEKIWGRGYFDAIVVSDYDKGTVNDTTIETLRKFEAPLTVVDSKRPDLRIFQGFNLCKLNESEYSAQVSQKNYRNVESLFDYVVVTRGSKGASLRQHDHSRDTENGYVVHSENFPVIGVKPRDVTGCGDTHTAAMTYSLLNHRDHRRAVRFANECAKNVVLKFGTSVVTPMRNL